MKKIIAKTAKILFKDEMRSTGLRALFAKLFQIEIGMYSYGCFDYKRIPKNTKIGKYCSFSQTCYIFNADHPKNFISTHPFFYNQKAKFVDKDQIKRTVLHIEDDVWIGHNATILSTVTLIGRGAIVGAGSVVTKNVPKYAIVGGIPAKILGYRFDKETIKKIENSEWWMMNERNLKIEYNKFPKKFTTPKDFYGEK